MAKGGTPSSDDNRDQLISAVAEVMGEADSDLRTEHNAQCIELCAAERFSLDLLQELQSMVTNEELTSSALMFSMDLLQERKATSKESSTLLEFLTDLLHEVRLKTATRGLTSTLLEISTDLLRELPSRLNGTNTVLGVNNMTVFTRLTPLRSEDPLRISSSLRRQRSSA
nr:hypothetical protein Iba_chr10cCG11340 [Ipomoea batatas]